MADTRGGPINFEEIGGLDKQIDVLLSCTPLPESQIKILCDKVSHLTSAQSHTMDCTCYMLL